MSKEFLTDVLDKFAQVTAILVETSKIKEDLDNKGSNSEILRDILERTKIQVDNLLEHATCVKELFYKHHKKVAKKLNAVNGKDTNKNQAEDDSLNSNSDVINSNELENGINKSVPQTAKPLIKLVDIKKLVEPRTLIEKKSTNIVVHQTKNIAVDDIVVVITSSDDEPPPTKITNTRPSRKTNIRQPKTKKTKPKDSDSEFSEYETSKKKTSRSKPCSKKKSKEIEKVTLSDTSSLSTNNSDSESTKSSHTAKNKKGQEKANGNTEKNDIKLNHEKDTKLNSECYVKVVRVPCEKLKEYYLEKLELLEIKKFREIKSLKRKRRGSFENSSGSDNKVRSRPKRATACKSAPIKDSTTEESDSADDLLRKSGSSTPDLITNKNPEVEPQNNLDQLAENALNLMNSDKEDSKNETSEEDNAENASNLPKTNKESAEVTSSNETEKEKENSPVSEKEDGQSDLASEKDAEKPSEDSVNSSEETNHQDDSPQEGTSTAPIEKETDKEAQTLNEKETEPEDIDSGEKEIDSNEQVVPTTEENNEKETESEDIGSKKKEIGDSEEVASKEGEISEDGEKESSTSKDKKKNDKKEWRKDKLLTAKLSSTDSEEEFRKFSKKKDRMQEKVESDEELKLPKDKKKRLVKKRLKKAILSDSDSDNKKDSADDSQAEKSSSSSDSEKEKEIEEEPEKNKPRKRVKRVHDSSSEDDEEKSTRKQIRNIWGRDSLAETTKKAEAEEKERKARIFEKQKKYNQIYESNIQKNASVEKVVLDFDEENNKELLKVDDVLVTKLKPHQASGIQFMWDACFESIKRSKSTKGSGCILAHCMGLGKTLQVIALSHTLLTHSEETDVRKILVVSPLNTVLNWVSEFRQWLPDQDDFEVFELVSHKQNYERQFQVKTWHSHGGVLVMGYDMFRNLSNPDNKRLSKKMRSSFQEALVDPGPDLVVCDEGHLLKNEKTNISIAMNRIRTLRRIVLTGTPLQNNLKEYFCMVQFIKPNLLGTYKEYLNRFVNPITNGQYTDSTQHDIQIMRKRSHVLHKMLDGVVQRRDYSVLAPYLPPKHEYVLFLSLTETQINLYQHYMDHFARRSTDGSNRTSFLFVDFQNLQRICTHPRVLLDKSIELKNAKELRDDSEESEGSLRDFIDDDDEEEEDDSSSSKSSSDETEKKRSAPRKRVTRAAAAIAKDNGEDVEMIAIEDAAEKEWWQEYCDGDELNNIAHSSKLFLLFEILKECEQIGDKLLLFSQSLYSLNIIEYFLGRIHDATQSGDTDSVSGYSGSWCLGLDYFRLDGSSSCDNRSAWCKTFNDPSNSRARLFLISTKAGGLGINLVAANRVIIFDVSWNPSHDIQSIFRVYRFGQTKPCYIYRFVTMGTMEMKIYERQVTKQAISKRVIDEQQIDRHYNQNDLAELYKFEPKPSDRPIPLVPKDVLLGELLQKFEDKMYKYHEHQTLLENKEEECLNEEERKAAWEEFENEKIQRNYLGNSYMRANNMEVALATIIQKENPTWTEIQIKAMIPTLYQELQEQMTRGDLTMYKRVQQEIQILHALQNQRLKEQFYQQQALRLMQQQQQVAAAMKSQNNVGGWLDHYMNQIPGTSRTQNATSSGNPSDVIDLID